MSLFKAYKIWEKKKKNSDFERIKISSSGSFSMTSGDLFNNVEDVKKYVNALTESLKNRSDSERTKKPSKLTLCK